MTDEESGEEKLDQPATAQVFAETVVTLVCDLCHKEIGHVYRDSAVCETCNFNVCDSCYRSVMHALIHEQGLVKERV